MTYRILACITALSLAAPAVAAEPAAKPAPDPAAAPAPAAEPAPPEDGADTLGAAQITSPPPGAPEDVALWREGIVVSDRIVLERLASNKMQWHSIQSRFTSRLETLAAKEGDQAAPRAVELLARFRPILAFNLETLARRWPVDPTRGCRYPVMHFEGVLQSGESKRRATQLLVTREELQDCVDRARPALKVLVSSNADLKAAIADVEAFLPVVAPAKPAVRPAPKAAVKPAAGTPGTPGAPSAKN